jgi:cytochrome c biogenesis protein CcmG/thiol:disulfide interchange protein DsbE
MPLVTFAGVAVAFAWGLTRNPQELPSALIGKPVPAFRSPPVQGRTLGLSSGDLKGQISLVNVFASWCVACRAEHPLLPQLAMRKTVPINGLNYKDAPQDAADWLDTLGDPYARTGVDRDGHVAIDWGVTGVPETFVVDASGIVVYKQIGPVTQQAIDETILPLVARLQQEAEGKQP